MASAENIYDELKWRGLVFQETGVDGVRDYLVNNKVGVYCGFDPTSDSLHIGNLVPLITLRRFQEFGNRAFPLAGGATGLIGDPSGKSDERNLQTPEDVANNLVNIKDQLAQIVDFSGDQALMVNNYDWISQMNVIEFLRDVGKHFSVNAMMQKDSVSSRLKGRDAGISFTEFTYMVLQGYDFLHLNREHNVSVQIGGSDQWGNMTAGTELIRRCTDGHGHCLTVPLITTADGKKFGKTEKGAVWLSREKTCPYDFYQYWINTQDADVINFLKYFTFLSKEEIESLEKQVEEEPFKRAAQKALAAEMTTMIHGEEEVAKSINTAAVLFGKGDISAVDAETLEALHESTEGPSFSSLEDVKGYMALLVEAGLATSGRDARTAITQNAISVNNVKMTDDSAKPTEADLLHGKYIVLKKGKKKFIVAKFA